MIRTITVYNLDYHLGIYYEKGIGVKKNVKGVGLKYNLDEKKLFTLWDKEDDIHKSIPTNITALNINKEQFIVEGEE